MLALVDPRSLQASPDPLSEEIRAALGGDTSATRRLCVELGPIVLRTLRRVLGASHPDLEDLLQDTLIGVLDGLRTFKGESSVRHYARRVATLRALETIRNTRTQHRKLEELGFEKAVPDDTSNPRLAFVTKRREQLLHELLSSLSPAHAETLVLQAVLGHSVAETAEIVGVPVNTVRGRLQTAKQTLREKILETPELSELLEFDDHDHSR
ncbi:RNA polymerase sigma factor [Labilithrix luteola]|uniref:RNA polymerase sigma factor n=1 Tax=Labilithrix luteola TaxID=1391654 RepID=UPI0011BAD9AE|nr:RNA polymerase sigma factor [Labilithrix luteola]